MAYHSSLYNFGNIIGYTGKPDRLPTVYFRCDRQQVAGRITQQHQFSFNVGRAQPRTSVGHVMRNEMHRGKLCLHEYRNGKLKHISRNAFISLEVETEADRHLAVNYNDLALIAQALRNFPNAKACADLDEREGARLMLAIRDKTRMLADLSLHAATTTDMRPSTVTENAPFRANLRAGLRGGQVTTNLHRM